MGMTKRCVVAVVAGFVFVVQASAQDKPKQQEKAVEKKAESPRDRLNRRFNDASPKLGSRLPDVVGFTADGKPISLRNLKGDYKVLVFGCFT